LRERTKTGQNRAKRAPAVCSIATRVIEVFGCVSDEENMQKALLPVKSP
jgi:hypothetical protein